jgi:hypothetical protein
MRPVLQGNVCNLWNPKGFYYVRNNPLPAAILSQINPVHTDPIRRSSILILFSHLRLCRPSGLYVWKLPSQMFAFLFFYMNAARPVRLSLLDLIILTMCGEIDGSWGSCWYSFWPASRYPPPPRQPNLNILLYALFSETHSVSNDICSYEFIPDLAFDVSLSSSYSAFV